MYVKGIKRCIDFILSFLALVVLFVPMLIITLFVKLDSKGPVLFAQKRVGKNKTFFQMYKFRTMYADTPGDVPTHLLENPNARITKVGSFLRRTSLDELPQIWNIFTGKMSIIGPRPALWNQDDLVAERDKYGANDLLPGLTGYAQVNGRDALPIPVKAELDGYYAKNVSFMLDLRIFFRTIGKVLGGSGVVEGRQGKERTTMQREAEQEPTNNSDSP